ncbi:hypothetical protein KIPB_004444, partial [Kipferlia bialata]
HSAPAFQVCTIEDYVVSGAFDNSVNVYKGPQPVWNHTFPDMRLSAVGVTANKHNIFVVSAGVPLKATAQGALPGVQVSVCQIPLSGTRKPKSSTMTVKRDLTNGGSPCAVTLRRPSDNTNTAMSALLSLDNGRCLTLDAHQTGYGAQTKLQLKNSTRALPLHRALMAGQPTFYPCGPMVYHPGANVYLSTGGDGHITVWNDHTKKYFSLLDEALPWPVRALPTTAIAVNPQGSLVAFATGDDWAYGPGRPVPVGLHVMLVSDMAKLRAPSKYQR